MPNFSHEKDIILTQVTAVIRYICFTSSENRANPLGKIIYCPYVDPRGTNTNVSRCTLGKRDADSVSESGFVGEP